MGAVADDWAEFDAWEARDRTLLEAAAIASARALTLDEAADAVARAMSLPRGYVVYEEYGTSHRPAPYLVPALDRVLTPERRERLRILMGYDRPPPDEEP